MLIPLISRCSLTIASRAAPFALPSNVRAYAPAPPRVYDNVFDLHGPAAAFVSNSHDPWFNLAFEDWLFRNTPPEQLILFLYRNRPSVIIGRNQNPWKEINFPALTSLNIPFVRRRSGGGTVYHDLGNTNYSILLPRSSFSRRTNALLVSRALGSLGVPAEVNERHDIVVDGFKVSGSAFKLVNARAYHHGTMLLDARLGDLGEALRNEKHAMQTKGVPSVRSPVRNIVHYVPHITHDAFVDAVVREFEKAYSRAPTSSSDDSTTASPATSSCSSASSSSASALSSAASEMKPGPLPVRQIDERELTHLPRVREIYEELQSWDWQYGQTPEFTYELAHSFSWGDVTANLTSKHGLITSLSLSSPHDLTALEHSLLNDRYASLDRTRSTLPDGGKEREVVEWLLSEM